MRRFVCLVLVVGLVALTGGCPMAGGSPGGTSGSLGSGGTTSGGSSGGQTDALTTQYPGCTAVADPDAWRDEVLQIVNQERTSRGLSALAQNSTLDGQAESYACEMIYYDFFDHENPVTGGTLADRADESGYDYVAMGENIAVGQQSPTEVMQSWMNSEGHRANILSPIYTEIGIGVRAGGQYGTYWVQVFGTPH